MIKTFNHSLMFLTISFCSLYQYQLSFSKVDEEASEQVVDAVFANFDVILSVNTERRELFDVSDVIVAKVTSEVNEFLDRFENVIDLEIENFEIVFDEIVVEIVDEVDEIVVEILSLSLLKFRLETILIIFFVDLT